MGRAKIFADAEANGNLDLSGFAPKSETDPTAAPPEQVRAIAEAANFRSREPTAAMSQAAEAAQIEPQRAKRKPRTHRTGRNVQFNVKASQETIDAFYEISDSQKWVLGETLDKALAALKREL